MLMQKSMIQDDVDDLEFEEEESKMKSQIDKFIEKISVDVQKNERGLYEDDLVFSTLISSFES